MASGIGSIGRLTRKPIAVAKVRHLISIATIGILIASSGCDESPTVAAIENEQPSEQVATDDDPGVMDPPWSEAQEGLQFRLRAKQTIWQSWQQPVVILDARNATDKAIPAAELQRRLPRDPRTGFTLMRKPSPEMSEAELYGLEVRVRSETAAIAELKSGDTLSLPLAITSTNVRDEGLTADRITIGLGRKLPRAAPEFISNMVPVQILPPGVPSAARLDTLLKRYDAGGQPVDAAFIPVSKTLVEGERILLSFVVRNPVPRRFSYTFGGDYRGANRHNRFKIEVRDSNGELLPDPGSEFGDFGGIVSMRNIEADRLTTDVLDLQTYRTIPGPGQYSVSARFDLTNEFDANASKFIVPVEEKFELTIQPRTDANVDTVLRRQFDRCAATSGAPLQELIDMICEFGREAAVPGLSRLADSGTIEQRREAIRGLGKVPGAASLTKLLELERDAQLRESGLLALGGFRDDRAVKRAIEALAYPDASFRQAAAAALGQMKSDAAVRALIERFVAANSSGELAAILLALGESGSPEALGIVTAALGRKEDAVRHAAVSAVVRFAPAEADAALRPYAEDEDMDFRETVMRTLAETLRAPIDADLLIPVIQSRRGTSTIGDAPRLLRLYTDDRAAPSLLSCLAFDVPAIRYYYNMTIIQNQLACRTGLAIPWIGDLNRDGTDEELQRNRETLASLKEWVDEYQRNPWSEPPEPWRLPHDQEEQTWGPRVGGIRLRARLNCSVWPRGLPQVITLDAISDGGSVTFGQRPEIVELEVNGEWYAHDRNVEMEVCGEWKFYKGNALQSFQLTPNWKRISDAKPLDLPPGEYTARMRLVPPPGTDRERLVTSPLVKFRVVGGSNETTP